MWFCFIEGRAEAHEVHHLAQGHPTSDVVLVEPGLDLRTVLPTAEGIQHPSPTFIYFLDGGAEAHTVSNGPLYSQCLYMAPGTETGTFCSLSRV